MKIYLKDEWAFVDMGTGYLLCIGRKEDVDRATSEAEVAKMVREAVATSQYQLIASGRKHVLH